MPQNRAVYRVAVGEDAAQPQRIYLVVADNAERAAALAATHSEYPVAWPLGQERNDVTSEEGILAMSEAS
jgi:hypothetical protein